MHSRDLRIPDAMSRRLDEGGYTFLHRVFRAHFDGEQKPMTISTGNMYVSYTWKPGDQTFLDGCTIVQGNQGSDTYKRFAAVAGTFRIIQAFNEAKIAIPQDTDLDQSLGLRGHTEFSRRKK